MNANVKYSSVWLACLVGASTTAQTYRVTDLGLLGRPEMGLNNRSQVTGTSTNNQAFRWDSGIATSLGTLGPTSFGRGINDAGDVVGYSYNGYSMRAVKFTGATPIDMGALPSSFGSYAVAMNNSGQAVGLTYTGMSFPYVATIWQEGTVTNLGTLAGGWSTAWGINTSGSIVGTSDNRAFIYTPAAGMRSLPDPPECIGSQAEAISDSSVIVGSTGATNFVSAIHAAAWRQGMGIDLGLLRPPTNFVSSYAHGVNFSEVIVGESDTLIGVHAFIFTFTNGMRDLNDFIPSSSGWVLTSATAINDSGQILGMGNYQGQQRAYLLTPKPQFTLLLAQGKLAFTLSGLAIQCRYTIEASHDLHTWSELRSFTATQTQTNWLDYPNSPEQRGYYRVHF